jgi:hypothetical protein
MRISRATPNRRFPRATTSSRQQRQRPEFPIDREQCHQPSPGKQPYDAGVPDQKPPRLAGGERETLQALLQYHRESLVRKVAGIDDESARRRFVDSDTTLLWLIKHAAGAEARWVLWGFAGQVDGVRRDDTVGPDDTVAAVVDEYRATWARVDAVVSAASLDDECRAISGDDVVNLRWIMTHLLEETARHAGHADILRELIDGQTGR